MSRDVAQASDRTHGPEIDDAMRAFEAISSNLVAGYEELAARAQRVEAELSDTNEELARKVVELDEVKGPLEAVLRAIPSGVVVRDARGAIARVNEAALDVLQSLDPAQLDSLEADETGRVETRTRDGRRLVLHAERAPIGDHGVAQGTVETIDDRTNETVMAERLHALDKTSSLGTMAAGIAHEIRNPLNAVQGFASLLLRELPDEGRARTFAERIVEGAAETDTIIAGMMCYAGTERVALEHIDAAELVDQAIRAALPPSDAGRWNVRTNVVEATLCGDRIKLRQALRNLVENAAQAQPDGGTIEVDVLADGESHVLRVTDDGPGIPSELTARVLDPFFTTRAEGTGLGLALTATIARLHGGDVEIGRARRGLRGTEIEIKIPRERSASTDVHDEPLANRA